MQSVSGPTSTNQAPYGVEFQNIILEKRREEEGAIGRITFNRPERLNVMGREMQTDIYKALDLLEQDDDIKVVIFRGAGRCWSAGFDLAQIGPRTREGQLEVPDPGERSRGHPDIRTRLRSEMTRSRESRILLYTKPTIAQVHGVCYGGAFFFSMDCDMTFAAEDASIGHMEQRMGFGGSAGNLPLEMNLIGFKRTREATLTGRTFTGKEAAEIGLINRAVPLERLEDEVLKVARLICLQPRDGLMIGKAQAQLAYHVMGFIEGLTQGHLLHMVFQGFKHAPDEFNFVKSRRELGTRGAIHARNDRYDRILKG